MPRVLRVPEVARRLGVASATVRNAKWRARVGLPLVRIGSRVGFLESDVWAVIQRGREDLDEEGKEEEKIALS